MPKEIQLSAKTLFKIAEALFLAYTQEQAAYLGGISERTLARILKTDLWQQILRQSLEMEKPYRKKIYRGEPGWQGAAWMLERKYASQLSKPEVQLSLNTGANVTNNTLVITAEQATNLKNRNASLDEALSKLSPPASRSPVITPFMTGKDNEAIVSAGGDSSSNNTDTKTLCNRAIEEKPPAPATRTPYTRGATPEPNLPPNSKILEPSTTKKKSVENSRNFKKIGEGGMVESPQLLEPNPRVRKLLRDKALSHPGLKPLKKGPGRPKKVKDEENFHPPGR